MITFPQNDASELSVVRGERETGQNNAWSLSEAIRIHESGGLSAGTINGIKQIFAHEGRFAAIEPRKWLIQAAQYFEFTDYRNIFVSFLTNELAKPDSYMMAQINEVAAKQQKDFSDVVVMASAYTITGALYHDPRHGPSIQAINEFRTRNMTRMVNAAKLDRKLSGLEAFNFKVFTVNVTSGDLDAQLKHSELDPQYWQEYRKEYAGGVVKRLVSGRERTGEHALPFFQKTPDGDISFLGVEDRAFIINFAEALKTGLPWLGEQKTTALELIADKVIKDVTEELARDEQTPSEYKVDVRRATSIFLDKLGIRDPEKRLIYQQIPGWYPPEA